MPTLAQHLAWLHPGWRPRVATLCERTGCTISSSWRPWSDQDLFWRCSRRRPCPPECSRSNCASANRPGESNHEYEEDGVPAALAADLNGTPSRIALAHRLAPELDLHFPIASENWHVQPIEVETRYLSGSPFPPVVSFSYDPWVGLFVPTLIA